MPIESSRLDLDGYVGRILICLLYQFLSANKMSRLLRELDGFYLTNESRGLSRGLSLHELLRSLLCYSSTSLISPWIHLSDTSSCFSDDFLDGYVALFSRGAMNGPREVPHGDAHRFCWKCEDMKRARHSTGPKKHKPYEYRLLARLRQTVAKSTISPWWNPLYLDENIEFSITSSSKPEPNEMTKKAEWVA